MAGRRFSESSSLGEVGPYMHWSATTECTSGDFTNAATVSSFHDNAGLDARARHTRHARITWAIWSRKGKAHYVSAEGQHINRPSPHPAWEAWASASAAEPAQEIARPPTVSKPQPSQPPLSLAASTRHLSPPAGIPPKGPVGRSLPTTSIPAKQAPHVRAPQPTGVYPLNVPTDRQLSVAQQNMPPQRGASATTEQHAVVTPPPDETFTWHCKRLMLANISDPCLHCNKCTTPTAQRFLSTIHKTEPISVIFELLIAKRSRQN